MKNKNPKPRASGVEIIETADLKPDSRNARDHSARNVGMIVDSLNEVGTGRSGVIDEDNNVLAGNATLSALGKVGIKRVKVVSASAAEWVVVRRTGLSKKQKQRLALFDNRTGELSDWDKEIMSSLNDGGALEGMFTDAEKRKFNGKDNGENEVVLEQAIQLKPQREYIVLICDDDGGKQFEQLVEALALPVVRRGGYKKGSPLDHVGRQRVIPASTFLERLAK